MKDLPLLGSLFDFLPDSRGGFLPVEQAQSISTKMDLPLLSPELALLHPTLPVIACTYVLQLLTTSGCHVMVTGERGSGKSLMLKHFCRKRKCEERQVRGEWARAGALTRNLSVTHPHP